MTSPAAAAAELERALSPHEQQLSELKALANLCSIQDIVVNRLTRLDLLIIHMLNRTKKILDGFLDTISELKTLTDRQHALYREIMVLKNTIVLYEFCMRDPAKMLQWNRGFSALWIVSMAMSQNGIKLGVFGGHEGFFHFGRFAWFGEENKYGNVLSSMNLLIQKMAIWAGVQQGTNPQVEDLVFQARLDNLRDDPVKLTAIERLVQAFADDAARKILAKLEKLPPAGSKNCRQA